MLVVSRAYRLFQSTPSMQRETVKPTSPQVLKAFQSTPSMQRETPSSTIFIASSAISIHSLYAEGDAEFIYFLSVLPIISIHSLYAEGDYMINPNINLRPNFNPLPLCRGRPITTVKRDRCFIISIHSLYAEGDNCFILV